MIMSKKNKVNDGKKKVNKRNNIFKIHHLFLIFPNPFYRIINIYPE